MIDRPSLAVIIACHNRRAKTLACLDSLAAQRGGARFSVFLFDDGCSDGTAEAVRRRHPEVTMLHGRGDAFWAGGMRAGFDHARRQDFDGYVWLNDDVVLDPDAVARLLDAERRLDRAGHRFLLVGGAVRDAADGALSYGGIESSGRLRFRPVGPWTDRPRPCTTLHGNVVLIPRGTAQRVGSIGSAYRHTLGDLDYGLRVRKAGGWVGLAPGFVGVCARNPRAPRWLDPAVSIGARWRLLRHPKEFPLRPWLAFARAHGGPLWPALALRPFWRLLVPAVLWRLFGFGGAHAPAA